MVNKMPAFETSENVNRRKHRSNLANSIGGEGGGGQNRPWVLAVKYERGGRLV
jgi:hypothetical protein